MRARQLNTSLFAFLSLLVLLLSASFPAQAEAIGGLTPATLEVLRLAQAGTSDDVLIAYAQNSQALFNLSADAILYLKDLGLSSQVLAGMLNHDAALHSRQPFVPTNQPAYPSPPPPGSTPETQPTAPPDTGEAPGNPPEDVDAFYGDLAPYGSWVIISGVGWCWQPSIVQIWHGWRPYCDGGHWKYTDAGWFWQSDYSWGWAPFHYGRWQLHPRCGWVWVPDRKWGPAWVVWRASGNRCGWAPLPPTAVFAANSGWRFHGAKVGADFGFGLSSDQFTFVSLEDFSKQDVGRHRISQTEAAGAFGQTRVVNNYTSHNGTIINRGIPANRIEAATHEPVPMASIRDLPASEERTATGRAAISRPGSEGTGGVVFRRTPAPQTQQQPTIHAQRVDAQHPTIVHRLPTTWTASRATLVPAPSNPNMPNRVAPQKQ